MEKSTEVLKHITILDLGSKGEAIGKYHGLTVFCDGALPGDVVDVEIKKKKKNYVSGDIVRFREKSPFCVVPICPVAQECGGCQIMQMDYKAQLNWKLKNLNETLSRIGGFPNNLCSIIHGMEHPYYYRNKAQFPIKRVGNEINIGFYRTRSHTIIPIEECFVQHPSNTELLRVIRSYIEDNSIPIYDETTHQGGIRKIVTKVSFYRQEMMVILVTTDMKLPNLQKLIMDLRSFVPQYTTLVQNINNTKGNVILGKKDVVLDGPGYIEDELGDLVFEISPQSFYQVNPIQTLKLYRKVIEFLTDDPNRRAGTVMDLFCGVGTIALFVAPYVKKVIGIEVIDQAIQAAKRNADKNRITNVQFMTGKVEELLPDLYAQGVIADTVLLDPPRKGCDESALQTIASMKPNRLIYVSCNPASLARDLAFLSQEGYEIKKIEAFDLFPHTTHVETVVLMSRVDK